MTTEILLKIILCLLFGGVIGAERELRSKSAGFRTMMMICLGSGMFTLCSTLLEGNASEATRISSNIVTGIGFLGAGVIFKGDVGVNGITTAATIWVTAAVGMLVGGGYFAIAAIATIAVEIILFGFTYIERWMDKLNQIRTYRMIYPYAIYQNHSLNKLLGEYGLRLKTERYQKQGEMMTGTWRVQGTQKDHLRFIEHMLDDLQVQDFEF